MCNKIINVNSSRCVIKNLDSVSLFEILSNIDFSTIRYFSFNDVGFYLSFLKLELENETKMVKFMKDGFIVSMFELSDSNIYSIIVDKYVHVLSKSKY